mmetsp:Transcript_16916/g.28644  ORF Transcript_16916/g.28644 Transcript_16916/m.28644 type:complete len:117 (+) Transcript_16916:1038-1388(+)
MWFGDLVTMKWWNDLWLKESFADYMAATNLLRNPELQHFKNSDQIFLGFLRDAMTADLLASTHPISVTVNHTEDAVNVFDRICYQKGASFIKQMSNYIGYENLVLSTQKYFAKYPY